MHHIQKHILKILTYQASARFSELRPARTDTNLFSYHLKTLLRSGLVVKDDRYYGLSAEGMLYVDRISSERFEQRAQAKIITMTLLRDVQGRVALLPRVRQPFIDHLTLPSGKVHLGENIADAARRELDEKMDLREASGLQHVGEAYIHAYAGDVLVSGVLAHIFTAQTREDTCGTPARWCELPLSADMEIAPGVRRIIKEALCTQTGQRFFLEVTESL